MFNAWIKPLICAIFILCIQTAYFAQDTCTVERKLVALDSQPVEQLGAQNAVDVYGEYAIAGGIGNNTNGIFSGAAHIFKRQGSEWVETQKIIPTDNTENDRFGKSVAIWGDYAVVGSPFDDLEGNFSGSAYVYQRIGQFWIQVFKLIPPDGLESDRFGWSVDIWQDYIIVGAQYDYTINQTYSGSAYIFKQNGEDWNFIEKLIPNDGGNYDFFGASVSIKDNLALIGASDHDALGAASGAAYLFANQGDEWTFQQKITASDASAGSKFGYSVDISENLITIGAVSNIVNQDTVGAVYIYRNLEAIWTEQQKILAPEISSNLAFGVSHVHEGDRLMVGAIRSINNEVPTGALFKYDFDGFEWVFDKKIVASDAANSDFYGYSLGMYGDYVITGAFGEDSNGSDAGAAYVNFLSCQPMCTSLSSPFNGEASVPLNANIEWYVSEGATGYKINIGTSPGSNDIINNLDVGLTNFYNPANDFAVDSEYYVSIIPYSDLGDADLCMESVFSTDFIPLSLTVGPDVSIPCNETVPVADYIVNNPCNEILVEVEEVLIPGDCEFEYTIERTYTADDGCSVMTETQIIHVFDEAPTILTTPNDTIIECGAQLPLDLPTVEDECQTSELQITFEDSAEPICGQVIERTFFVTDDCGNVATSTQQITIETNDDLPTCSNLIYPIGDNVPLDVTLEWSEAGAALGYSINVGTSLSATDILSPTDVGSDEFYSLFGLPAQTTIFVNIIPYNSEGEALGCQAFTFTTGIANGLEEINLSNMLSLFPNPNNGREVNIIMNEQMASNNISILRIVNVLGEEIDYHSVEGQNVQGKRILFDNELIAGWYIIQLSDGAHYFSKSFVVD